VKAKIEEVKVKKEGTAVKKEVQSAPPEDQPIKKEEPKTEAASVRPVSNPVTSGDGKGGYFHSQFETQLKTHNGKVDETASAGIFKTASGWQDEKYYVLMDKVEPGTIIRIVNPTNSKSVYAKVLGEMSGIRQNQGYDIRMSNAAASALQISDTEKFIVRINY
jgi:translation elongation factor EF-G